MTRIAVLITCHNRREKTLACLDALTAANSDRFDIQVFLVDDGSTDGTGDAVRARFPEVKLIQGDGNLYWNGGMRRAHAAAMVQPFDFMLWLNDDTYLFPETLTTLMATYRAVVADTGTESIVLGTTCDLSREKPTYGGLKRYTFFQRLTYAYVLVAPQTTPVEVETMNGNCALIPATIARALGNLDSAFTHALGDWDYGFRARAAGYRIWITPGYAGICANPPTKPTVHPRTTVWERLRRMQNPKELPIKEWATYTKRYTGPLWPLHWLKPYVSAVLAGVLPRRP